MTILFFIVYNILIISGIIIIIPFILLVKPSYLKHVSERMGKLPRMKGAIWVHAASVGEVKASIPLLKHITSLGYEVLLTTVTSAGRQYGATLKIKGLNISYAPLDSMISTLYAVHRLKPKTLVIIETELWPNMILAAALNGVSIVSVNARLTQKALNGYMYIHPVMRFLLKRFKLICVQTVEDRDRFLKLGAETKAIQITGNIKYAIAPNRIPSSVMNLKKIFSDRHIIIAGSTHQGEEQIVINCLLSLKQVFNMPLLILAPRHLNRIDEVEILIKQASLNSMKRSSMDGHIPTDTIDILLLDTIGELADIYSIGDAIFVGGSMVPIGGHNLLEVVIHKKPVIYGQHIDTIRDFVSLLNGNGGIMAHDENELCEAMKDLLEHSDKAEALGKKAFDLIAQRVDTLNNIINIMKKADVL
jgi:3-deoxy-D-manno-octulosonic-acid transferase